LEGLLEIVGHSFVQVTGALSVVRFIQLACEGALLVGADKDCTYVYYTWSMGRHLLIITTCPQAPINLALTAVANQFTIH